MANARAVESNSNATLFCLRILKLKERGILQMLPGRHAPRNGLACHTSGDYDPVPLTCVMAAVYLFFTGLAVSTCTSILEKFAGSRRLVGQSINSH